MSFLLLETTLLGLSGVFKRSTKFTQTKVVALETLAPMFITPATGNEYTS